MKKIFKIVVLNYGFSLEYRISEKEFNPNKKGCSNDGSIEKYSAAIRFYRYSNPYAVFHFFWNYTILFRLILNRD